MTLSGILPGEGVFTRGGWGVGGYVLNEMVEADHGLWVESIKFRTITVFDDELDQFILIMALSGILPGGALFSSRGRVGFV